MTLLLYNEWLKFKKTKLILWSLLLVVMPLAIGISLKAMMDPHLAMDASKYINAILWIYVRFLSLCVFTYVACEHMAMEFKTQVWKDQWTIPISRSAFYMSKIIFLSLWSLGVCLLSACMSIFFVLVFIGQALEAKWLVDTLIYFTMASVLTWPFMYGSVLMMLWLKKVWLAMTIHILILIASLMIIQFSWSVMVPTLSPLWIIFSMGHVGRAYISLGLFSSLVLILGHYYLYKVEV